MEIRYVIGTQGNSVTPIPLIRVEMTIEEARSIEADLLEIAAKCETDTSSIRNFISGMIMHLDQQEIPSMPGLQESIELLADLRKLIDGRLVVLTVKRGEYAFSKQYLEGRGIKIHAVEDVWRDTFTLIKE